MIHLGLLLSLSLAQVFSKNRQHGCPKWLRCGLPRLHLVTSFFGFPVLSHRLGRASSAMFRSMDAAPSIAPEIAPSTPAREPRTESLMLSREEGHSRRWMSTQVPLIGFGLAPRWQFPHPCTHSCPIVRSTPKSSRVSKGTVGGGKTRVKI